MVGTSFEWFSDFARSMVDRFSPPVERVTPQPGGGGVDTVVVREGYQLRRFDFRGPKRAHQIDDLPSLLAYVQRYGRAEHTTVFVGAERFVAVLDDTEASDINRITYPIVLSTAARRWLALMQKRLGHVDFKEALSDRRLEIVDHEPFLAQLVRFRHRSEVEYDADLDNGTSIGFKVTEGKDKYGTATVQREFEIDIPLFIGWEKTYRFAMRLDFAMVDAGEGRKKPVFSVAFRDYDEVYAQAIEDLLEHTREQLGATWLVVRGTPAASEAVSYSPASPTSAPTR